MFHDVLLDKVDHGRRRRSDVLIELQIGVSRRIDVSRKTLDWSHIT